MEELRELMRRYLRGERTPELSEKIRDAFRRLSPLDLARVEESLRGEFEEGEILGLCELHLLALGEEVKGPEVQPTHPLHVLLEEHRFFKEVMEEMESILQHGGDPQRLAELFSHLKEYDNHKLREENALFPYLEKHGMARPPRVMWMEHDHQRKEIREMEGPVGEGDLVGIKGRLLDLIGHIRRHFQKEEGVLFPSALRLLSDEEWKGVKASMDEVGYCSFTPEEAKGRVEVEAEGEVAEGEIKFPTGSLTVGELQGILDALPLELTFVDAEDRVRYFNRPKERIFLRTKAVIGRKVHNCHPQKSLPLVQRILDEFRSGKRDDAQFWIDLGPRKVHIRFLAVRGAGGKYLGCLEVVQDITDLRGLQGEKRLLDD